MYNSTVKSLIDGPDILNYTDVLAFLNDHYKYRKGLDRQFNFDIWSYQLGYKSRTFMYLICTGRRSIMDETVKKLSACLSLDVKRKEHFFVLANMNNQDNPEFKQIFKDKIFENLNFQEDRLTQSEYEEFLLNPQLMILKVLLSFKDMDGTKDFIRKHMNIDHQILSQYLRKLIDMKMITSQIDEKTQKTVYRSQSKNIKFPDQVDNKIMENCNASILNEALVKNRNTENFKKMRSTLFAIDPQNFEKMNDEIESFVSKIKHKYASESIEGHELIRLNLQAYSLKD
jgi:uncharacterized protein (TIGR02147 family)